VKHETVLREKGEKAAEMLVKHETELRKANDAT
jgi:hypothetical protein